MNRWLHRVYLTLASMCTAVVAVSCSQAPLDSAPGPSVSATRTASTWHKRIDASTSCENTVDGGFCIVNGRPAISYHDDSTDELMFVRALDSDGTLWGTPVTVDTTGTAIGAYSSLAVVDGYPAIAYQDNDDLCYVQATNTDGTSGNWGTPVVLDNVGETGIEPSLVVLGSGKPAVGYFSVYYGLSIVRAQDVDGSSWNSTQPLDGSASAHASNLAIINTKPAMVYEVSGSGVYFLQADSTDGSTWNNSPVLVDSNNGYWPALVEASGGPLITWNREYTNGVPVTEVWACRALNANGTSWDSPFYVGPSGTKCAMTIVGSYPYLTYKSSTGLVLARATNTTGAAFASPETVDSASGIGNDTNILVVSGKPAIVGFRTSSPFEVAFWSATDSTGRVNGLIQTLADSGASATTAIVDEYPAIAYTTGGNLKYKRSTDDLGDGWGSTVSISTTGHCGSVISMIEADDKPAICYFDTVSRRLYFVRATDDTGTTWGSAVIVDSTNSPGGSCSMALIWNGSAYWPAIAYLDTSSGTLLYQLASNATGSSWPGGGSAVQVDTNANPSYGLSMVQAVSNLGVKYPAIAYTSDVFVAGGGIGGGSWVPYLRYVCASAVGGSSWNSPVTLDTLAANVVSMAFTGTAKPAVGYYVSGAGLKYCRSTSSDLLGTSWSSAQSLTSSCTGLTNTSMKLLYSKPSILYTANSSEVKYARPGALDLEGSGTWGHEMIDTFGDSTGRGPSLLELTNVYYPGAIFGAYSFLDPNSTEYIRVCTTTPTL